MNVERDIFIIIVMLLIIINNKTMKRKFSSLFCFFYSQSDVQKFGVAKVFFSLLLFLEYIFCGRQCCINLIKNTVKLRKISNSNIVMHYYKSRKQNNKKKHNCFPVIVKLNFQQSVLQSSVSHHTSEIIL